MVVAQHGLAATQVQTDLMLLSLSINVFALEFSCSVGRRNLPCFISRPRTCCCEDSIGCSAVEINFMQIQSTTTSRFPVCTTNKGILYDAVFSVQVPVIFSKH